jgi:hypothetical protein
MRGKTFPDVEQRADVRVGEGGDGARLALESRATLRVGTQFGGQELQRNRAAQARVPRLVDLTHASGAYQSEDFVGPKARTRGQRHGGSCRGLYVACRGPHVSRKAVVKVSVAYRYRQRDAPPPA